MPANQWRVEVLLAGSWRGATSVLLRNAHQNVVVDTGMPHERYRLVDALRQRGLKPSDVQAVINTHFHVDHVLNNCLFPKSVVYASQRCYDWCRSLYSDIRDDSNWEKLVLKYYPELSDYARAREHMSKLRKLTLRWWDPQRLGSLSQFRWLESSGLPEGLASLVTWGHVPGHISVIVPTASRLTVIAGDALVSREDDARVLTMIPHNRKQFHHDCARILSIAGRVVPGHDGQFSNDASTGIGPKAS